MRELAAFLITDHNDYWLRDFINASRDQTADKEIATTIFANRTGDLSKAILAAEHAAAIYERLHNTAAIALIDIQLMYSFRRAGRAKECSKSGAALRALLANHSYSRINADLAYESGVCAALLENFDDAFRFAQQAKSLGESSKYASTILRVQSLAASLETSEGRVAEAWTADARGLEQFWSMYAPPERGFQFYSDMAIGSESRDLWSLSFLLQGEALSLLKSTDRTDFKALAHLHLANAASKAGLFSIAASELAASQSLFRSLPLTPENRLNASLLEIAFAQLDIHEGRITSALSRLRHLDLHSLPGHNFFIDVEFERTWAETERILQNADSEERHLVNLIEIAEQGKRSLRSEIDRWKWLQETKFAYKRLLELKLLRPHSPAAGLALWEAFQSSRTSQRVDVKELRRVFVRKSTPPVLPPGSSLLAIGAFDQVAFAWLTDEAGVHEYRVGATPKDLQTLAEHFRSGCSDPSNSIQKVKGRGSRLYKLLVSPVAAYLVPGQELRIDTDDYLSSIPWPALWTDNGRFLGEEFRIVRAIGKNRTPRRVPPPLTQVVIAHPGSVAALGITYPELPHAELEVATIRDSAESTIDRGGDLASRNRILNDLKQATAFHFVGHAISRPDSTDLVLRGPDGYSVVSSRDIVTRKFRRLSLVVLAACSTAGQSDIGRDPDGLVRAFISSGAEYVVASHWDVDSKATATFVAEYYTYLSQGINAADAAHFARDSLIKTAGFSHPYFWSAFEVYLRAGN